MITANDILKGVLGWVGDFSAIFAADKAAGAGSNSKPVDRTEALVEVARKLAEAEKFNRAEFLLELDAINVDSDGQAQPLLDLFDELWEKKGVLFVGRGKQRRSYRENEIGHLLQMIPIPQRQTEYIRLAQLLAKDRKKFFSRLEILHDDRFLQIERQFVREFEESPLGKSIISAASELADPLETLTGENGTLRNLRDRLRNRAIG